ncbi:MAG: hypothetical protein V4469_00030 [Patescibacteria group bacterium]
MQGEREEYNTETLEKLYVLTQENNVMLKKLQKYQKINTALRVIYWVIILISIFGAYFALQPFIASLFGGDSSSFNSMAQNFPEVSKIKEIINGFGN